MAGLHRRGRQCLLSIPAAIVPGRDDNFLVVVANCTPVTRENYRLGVSQMGFYSEIFNTDAECYGGSNTGNRGGVEAEAVPWGEHPYSLNLKLPPLAATYFKRQQR